MGYLSPDSPLAVVTLVKETSLGHARLCQVDINTAALQPLLKLHSRQLVVQLGIGVGCEVTGSIEASAYSKARLHTTATGA